MFHRSLPGPREDRIAGSALADSTANTPAALSRAQVNAELREAIRTGNISAGGELGLTQRELHPGLYPAVPATEVPRDTTRLTGHGERART